MVDPKRHINILSEEDQLFLNECEEEFKDRFTERDDEFQAYCAQQARQPPVLEPWQQRNNFGDYRGGGRGRFNDRGRYNHHHHNNRNRDYRDRGPYDGQQHNRNRYNNNYHQRDNRDRDNRDNRNNRFNSNPDRRY